MEDIVIRGGMVADGTGSPAFIADVAVRDGKITAIGSDLSDLQAEKILDAEGCVVAPGFIDAHAHSDTSFLLDGSSASKLYQGVTTEVCGQCGGSPFPALEKYCRIGEREWVCSSFDEFVKRFESGGYSMAVNQAMLTGHGSLRAGVIAYAARAVTRDEMETMKRLLRADLEAGAWGMSLGLEYAPGCFADTDGLSELVSVVKE
ncbi:MAG: amidohydrolase family protein, partial [Lachnospiraceae bacterium]|nr:amidohydrolase family protein [Lachnospiraceae bacterium]